MSIPAAGQKRLVIVGATGMVGGYALRYALDHPGVGRVTAIGRRKLSLSHPKLTQVQHLDFADCSALGDAFGPGRRDLLPRYLYRGGIGCGTPQDHRGLHHRVRARSPRQQSWRDVLVPEREWCGPDGTKPDGVRTLQGRGRERATRNGLSPRLHLPARLHLPRGAAQESRISATGCCARSTRCFGCCSPIK
jgi:hypothetical protein